MKEQMSKFASFATTDGEISAGEETQEEKDSEAARLQADATARAAAQLPLKEEPEAEVAAESAEGEVAAESAEGEEKPAAVSAAAETPPAAKPGKKTAAERSAEIQARIASETRTLRETQRQIAEEQARLEALRKGGAQPGLTAPAQSATVSDDVAPDSSKFEFGELDSRYIDAKIAYGVKQALKAAKASEETTRAQQARESDQAALRSKLQTFTEAGAAKYNDFEDVVVEGAKAGDYQLSEHAARLLLASDVGPDVAYYLASNPKEARILAGKSPLEQAASIGRLEARFSAPASGAKTTQTVKTTQAPTPMRNAKGGGGSTQVSPATNDFAAFERMAMAAK